MKKTKFLTRLTAFVITLSIALPFGIGRIQPVSAAESNKTPSQTYVEAMGNGWNLCNTYDAVHTEDFSKSDETVWGMPVVTKALIKAVKAKGFDSLRIPLTAFSRYSLVDGHYVINAEWLAKYKQTVDWAVGEGLYVMINLHHDSWTWLSSWDGNKSSEEYKSYIDLWAQLADTFKDAPEQVCFETINEPQFNSDTGSITKQDKLDMINKAAYDVIRSSGGNNATRMIVIPTMNTNHADGKSDTTYNFIASLNDPNIIATVHYYSEWVYSANLGKTGFDEQLYDDRPNYTPRAAAQQFYETIYKTFTAKGIGVVVGEYGLLSPDFGPAANQVGEKLKYFELMNSIATEKGISLMLWQNVIDRNDTKKYSWNPALLGAMVDAALLGERSSYATGLDEIYLSHAVDQDLQIPLTLNGNKFKGIEGLNKGKDYSYDEATSTVILSKDFINSTFNTLTAYKYGTIAELVMKFSAGADWHQYIIKNTSPILKSATGTTSAFNIPVNFNGAKLRRASAYDASGNRVGPNSGWWPYLGFGGAFTADYDNSTINILKDFFNDGSVKDGTIKFTFEFYDGQKLNYIIEKSGTNVTGKSEVNVANVTFDSKGGTIVEVTSGNHGSNNGGAGTSTSGNGTSVTLPQTGSVIDTTFTLIMGIILITSGSLLIFKKRRVNA